MKISSRIYAVAAVTLLAMLCISAIALRAHSQNAAMSPVPKTAQSIMQSVGRDWQAMAASLDHVATGLSELQTYAQGLEAKNAQLTAERDELKAQIEKLKAEKKP